MKTLRSTRATHRNTNGLRVPSSGSDPNRLKQPHQDLPVRPPTALAQTLSFLPHEIYNSTDHSIARKIPFYALHNIFRLVAASEHQFLNLMEQKIQDVGRLDHGEDHRDSIAEIFAMKKLIETHKGRLRESLEVIEARGGPVWRDLATSAAEAAETSDGSSIHDIGKKSEEAAESLQRIFYQLVQRANTISSLCQDETARLSHDAVVHEAQRSLQQAEGLSKLTLIAFIFVPLSFTTSFFGMNIDELNSSGQPIWTWFVLSVPILALSVLAWWLNRARRRRMWASVKRIVSRKSRAPSLDG